MNILDKIVQTKRKEVAQLPEEAITSKRLAELVQQRGGVRDFASALLTTPKGDISLIAEVKKASPSAGIIRADFDPVRIARQYEGAGAACLSVLTDEEYFQGSLRYLTEIRKAVDLPLLRKDFIIDERQIVQSVQYGADAILLIVAILDDSRLNRFHEMASSAGLSVLVEVHDEAELDRAMAIGARLIGVNNRNLKDFKVDLATTENLATRLFSKSLSKQHSLLVAESGIHSRQDVVRVRNCGARAILVGESLMRHAEIAPKVAELISDGPTS